MKRAVRIVVGSALVLAAVLATGALTRFDYRAGGSRGELRLAWRMAVPRVVECRTPTAEELEELPVHMRQDEICEGRPVSYRLEVRVDGQVRHRATVRAEGARADRPMQIFETLPLEPGVRDVRVVFERADRGEASSSEATSLPDRLVFHRRLDVAERDVVLVTWDPDRRALVRMDSTGG